MIHRQASKASPSSRTTPSNVTTAPHAGRNTRSFTVAAEIAAVS